LLRMDRNAGIFPMGSRTRNNKRAVEKISIAAPRY
jgi:hypothetical protein